MHVELNDGTQKRTAACPVQQEPMSMTTITIVIDDPNGGDSSLLFPSAWHSDIQFETVGTSTASLSWVRYFDGVADNTVLYEASFGGNTFESSTLPDVRGNVSGATLTRSVDGGTAVQIMHATFSLDGLWQTFGGVYIPSWASLTVDALANRVTERTLLTLSFVGNVGNDKLTGSFLSDIFDGGAGADTMIGGLGDDVYNVENHQDKVIEAANQGIDTVNSAVSFSLAGQHIENLTLTTTNPLNATGNSLNNVLTGNAANNIINGKSGSDTMRGLGGNDRYYVDNVNDAVVELIDEGTDHVVSSVTFKLTGQYIEWLTLTGSANINGTGNSLNNTITSNSGSNVIRGYTGNDRFVFNSAADTGKGATRDVILDFEDFGDNDTIDLSGFAGTLVFSNASSLSGALNEVIARQSGNDVLIQINTVVGGGAEAEILLANTLRSQITASDFDLV
jgi:Ca2+-binding RTX toxin-like protein